MRTGAAPGGGDLAVAVASLYQPYLVTRQTGRAVRDTIERLAAERSGAILTVLDLAEVAIIDFSCADEVVAKLVLSAREAEATGTERFFLIRGLDEHHTDPVASALRRRGLAVAARDRHGEAVLLGDVPATFLPVWRALAARGRAGAAELCGSLELDVETCGRLLDELYRNRLVRRCGDEYESLEACYAAFGPGASEDPPAARPE